MIFPGRGGQVNGPDLKTVGAGGIPFQWDFYKGNSMQRYIGRSSCFDRAKNLIKLVSVRKGKINDFQSVTLIILSINI